MDSLSYATCEACGDIVPSRATRCAPRYFNAWSRDFGFVEPGRLSGCHRRAYDWAMRKRMKDEEEKNNVTTTDLRALAKIGLGGLF